MQLEELEKVLKIEQEKMLQQNEKHETVAAEYKKLRDEKERWSISLICVLVELWALASEVETSVVSSHIS